MYSLIRLSACSHDQILDKASTALIWHEGWRGGQCPGGRVAVVRRHMALAILSPRVRRELSDLIEPEFLNAYSLLVLGD
jgi:hypothetical protein